MSQVLIQTSKGEALDADGDLYEYIADDADRPCDDCPGNSSSLGFAVSGWETSDRFVCDDCVNVISLEDACNAIEQVAALKNAFEFIFGKSKVKTVAGLSCDGNDEIVMLHCFECKQLIKFGEGVYHKGHSYCIDCFFKEAD